LTHPVLIVMPTSSEVLSHWHHSVENLNTSAMGFYNSIEKALSAKKVPVERSRVLWNEGGVLSAQREYLRISYGTIEFDVSAFPFGTDYYFSWWLTKSKPGFAALFGCLGMLFIPVLWIGPVLAWGFFKGTIAALLLVGVVVFFLGQMVREGASDAAELIVSVPYLGPIFERLFSPMTYYSEDTRKMFEETVHRVVLDVVSGILAVNNMKPLTPEEAKPKGRQHRLIEAALGTE
jgi:hypothetical protein